MAKKSVLRRLLRFVRIWLFICSGGCLGVGLGFAFYTSYFLSTAAQAAGKVIALNERYDQQSGDTQFAPVFSFVGNDGKSYTVTSSIASNPSGFAVGDQVKVRYLSSNPRGAKIGSFMQLWLVTMVLGILTCTHGLLAAGILYFERKSDRRSKKCFGLGLESQPSIHGAIDLNS